VIEISHLQKVIGQVTVVDIETLNVAAGEVAAIIGPAGSDRSTLLNLLIGHHRPLGADGAELVHHPGRPARAPGDSFPPDSHLSSVGCPGPGLGRQGVSSAGVGQPGRAGRQRDRRLRCRSLDVESRGQVM